MDLLLPGFGILTWTLLAIVAIIIPIFTIYKLATNQKINGDKKLIWLLIILLFPIVGSGSYYIFSYNKSFQ